MSSIFMAFLSWALASSASTQGLEVADIGFRYNEFKIETLLTGQGSEYYQSYLLVNSVTGLSVPISSCKFNETKLKADVWKVKDEEFRNDLRLIFENSIKLEKHTIESFFPKFRMFLQVVQPECQIHELEELKLRIAETEKS